MDLEDTEESTRRPYDPLAASVDHIVPRARGGGDEDGNLQITHRRCNQLKHDHQELRRAQLSLTLDGIPLPARIWQREMRWNDSRTPPAREGTPAWRFERKYGRKHVWLLRLVSAVRRGEVAIEPWRLLPRYQIWVLRMRLWVWHTRQVWRRSA